MRRYLATLLFAALAAGASEAPHAQARPRTTGAPAAVKALPAVQKIYVGDMGADDEAERFRLLLEEQLIKRGFEAVLDPKAADAVLTGVLSVRVYDDKSEARATVRLVAPDGAVLWARDFGHKRFAVNPFSLQEPARRRAEEVAEALKREFRRPARKGP